MIGVLTADFAFYHDLLQALHRRNVPFTSLSYDEPVPPAVEVVVTTEREQHAVPASTVIAYRPGQDLDALIDRALVALHRKSADAEIVIGVDPGATPGVAIFDEGRALRRCTAASPVEAVRLIRSFVEKWSQRNITIRIGHGARLVRNRMINMLRDLDVPIEIVDETSTTPPNTHDDIQAATAIALNRGTPVERELSVEPKDGEIRDVQRRSRIASTDVTISKALAKQVLQGKLGMDAAIEKQRKK